MHMKEKIQPIIDDLKEVLAYYINKEDYEVCESVKEFIDNFTKYMNDELEYHDISTDVLEICMMRYELLKTQVIGNNRYVMFSAFGNWLLFWVDSKDDKSELWDEVLETQKRQDEMIVEQMVDFHNSPTIEEEK